MSRRRLLMGVGVLAIVTAGATGVVSTGALSSTGADPSAAASSGAEAAPTTAEIERRTMRTTKELDGTLGYDGDLAILAGSGGTVTWLPSDGAVIERDGKLYELDGSRRARLMYGARPTWRTLGPGVSNGADVKQLEQNLKAMGYTPKGMKVNRHWDSKTTRAVRRWQKATGQRRDGTVEPGDVVFQRGPIRVREAQAALGSQAAPGAAVLAATSADRVVSVDLDATDRDEFAPGDTVSVELPDGTIVDGHVASLGTVAEVDDQSGSATLPVTITLDDSAAAPDLDQAPVTVLVVRESREDVLAVPVNALVALQEGGYAVEVVDDDGSRRYVGVATGLFDDGWVEISGAGLDAGTRVVTAR